MDATSSPKKPKLVIVEDEDPVSILNKNGKEGTGKEGTGKEGTGKEGTGKEGTGKAGGAQTNKNGLSYEDLTNLKPFYEECTTDKKEKFATVKFVGYDHTFINANKSALHKWMEKTGEKNPDLQPAAGCKEPDEAYIDTERHIAFIIEKKFQQTSGSVDEKIQTAPFKKEHYQELFPNYKIHYLYCLSDWFKREEYKSVLNYLEKNQIPVFWGSSETYKQEMIAFMHSSL